LVLRPVGLTPGGLSVLSPGSGSAHCRSAGRTRRRRALTLARAEALEHMSPQERMSLNLSGRRLAALPPDRQALVKRAFQDLRSVPLDQRQTELNSSRYQSVFSPEERGILSDFLRAEPYEPAR
ncbi:MAG: DUF3106 domain-containing protein, partial [Terracidiphilus sp.]